MILVCQKNHFSNALLSGKRSFGSDGEVEGGERESGKIEGGGNRRRGNEKKGK